MSADTRFDIAGKRILLVGAGGAARGAMGALLEQNPAALVVANRSDARAIELAALFATAQGKSPSAASFDDLADERFDIVINATAASLAGEAPRLPAGLYADDALAYDMMYAKQDTPFMRIARAQSARVSDGLGMLVEQAAESFFVWRALRPATRPVLASLRRCL